MAARRQLPGRAARADGPPHVADQHRHDAPLDARRPTTSATSVRASSRSACGARSTASCASPHYQGHLLNWYDTKNLQPLLPQYVSTVDSGNFAGCLVALKHGCRGRGERAPSFAAKPGRGSRDSIDLLEEVLASAPGGDVGSLRSVLLAMQVADSDGARDEPGGVATRRFARCARRRPPSSIASSSRSSSGGRTATTRDPLRALRTSIDRLHQQLRQMRQEIDALLPWLAFEGRRAQRASCCPPSSGSTRSPRVSRALRAEVDALGSERRRRGEALRRRSTRRRSASTGLSSSRTRTPRRSSTSSLALARRARTRRRAGWTSGSLRRRTEALSHRLQRDASTSSIAHHYDLLASEARLASYLAIVKRDVPESHWYALGRPMTQVAGAPALLSWGGTMFEYLMPALLMRSRRAPCSPRRARSRSTRRSPTASETGAPWGISESAYARVDARPDLPVPVLRSPRPRVQARARRATSSSPRMRRSSPCRSGRTRSPANVAALEAMGMLGHLRVVRGGRPHAGPRRRARTTGRRFAVVRSYMAHHQGMLLVALSNVLNRRSMVDRFHADAVSRDRRDAAQRACAGRPRPPSGPSRKSRRRRRGPDGSRAARPGARGRRQRRRARRRSC